MQIAAVCLLAVSTTASAGDNRKCTHSAADKTCPPACQVVGKKSGCDKATCNAAGSKQQCGMKK